MDNNINLKSDGSPMNSQSFQSSPHYRDILSPLVADSSVSKKDTPAKSGAKKGVSRALKACNTCRKQKTKCFPSKNSIGCIRCSSLGAICSFEEEAISNNVPSNVLSSAGNNTVHDEMKATERVRPNHMANNYNGNGLVETRLKMLQSDVNEILHILTKNTDNTATSEYKEAESTKSASVAESNIVTPMTDISRVKLFQYSNSIVDLNNLPSFGVPSATFNTSPFKTFDSLCSSVKVVSPVASFVKNEKPQLIIQVDVISLGLITFQEGLELLQNFRDRYGRWVSFPDDISTESLLMNIRKNSSLLLTSCCCLSLKYGNIAIKQRVYHKVFTRLKVELSENIAHIPQTIEFLQSLVILSLYGITLSTSELIIDSWYITGIGLQQFISKDLSGNLFDFENIPSYYSNEFYELTVHRIWNHLALAHIVYCNFSGKMCIIDELRLSLSRKILELSSSTNFDGRIVAEISSQLIVYNFIQFRNDQQSLPLVKEELREWFDQWSYLFDQPSNQFVELGYHYGYLLILYNWNHMKLKSENDCTEILLNADSISIRSMIFHCQKIVDTMLVTPNDSYFAFLSDQVHFSANFGIVMLMRILHVINLQKYNKGNDHLNKVEMSKNELHKNLSNCSKLSKRYKRISTGEFDIFMKYHLQISETMSQLFPEFKE